ncbi:reverse transcriptase-like protein [Lutibacter sp. B2]|nr:reverse transcriptase-like protein [Lutibacter sp. B2]
MITAYLLGISTHYEGEDVEIRLHVLKDQELLLKETFFKEYEKPLVVEHVALLELLNRLEKFKEEDITVIINNPALYEQIRGTSTSKNRDVMNMARKVRERLKKFGNSVIVKDVSDDKVELTKWKEILES